MCKKYSSYTITDEWDNKIFYGFQYIQCAGKSRIIENYLQSYVKTGYNTSKKMQICLYKSALIF